MSAWDGRDAAATWSGPYWQGATRDFRSWKRGEAARRNTRTLPQKRSLKAVLREGLNEETCCPFADKTGVFASPQKAMATLAKLAPRQKKHGLHAYKCPGNMTPSHWHLGKQQDHVRTRARAA